MLTWAAATSSMTLSNRACDCGIVPSIVRRMGTMFALKVCASNAARSDDQKDSPSDQECACNWYHDLICCHENNVSVYSAAFSQSAICAGAAGPISGGLLPLGGSVEAITDGAKCMSGLWKSALPGGRSGRARSRRGYVSTVPADSSRSNTGQTATSCPNAPAFSAHIPLPVQSANLSSPKQEDLKWLTTTSRNLRRTGRTAFRTTQGRARVAWGLSSSALSLCSLCYTPSSEALPYRLSKTQAQSHPLSKRHPRQRNNEHHSRLSLTGRGTIPAHRAVRSLDLPPHIELGGHNASATEVRPC